MEIAMGAIGPLLPKLHNLLVGEFTLEKRVRKGIEPLVTELTLMHAALRKVAKVPPEQLDERVKIWAGHVKELSYQMEDIVDAFMVSVDDGGEQANPNNRFKKLIKKIIRLFKEGRDLHRISDAMEEAVGQSKQLAELRQRYEQETWDTSNGASVDPRIMALYTDVEELVGIEGPRDELINMLAEDDTCSEHPLKTVSIFGFGGLGKTTIAKTTYDKIRVQFDCDAFVSVSQNPDIRKVFKDILYELDKDMYEDIHNSIRDERQLIDLLKDFLQNKRYLIVIDDIWDKYTWQLINCAFSKNSFGSRLITTTRILSVSEACCSSSDDICRMKPLSNDVSRLLFHRRVFYHEKECPQELVQVSEDILNKCGGIPLAIITIGSLLVNNNQRKTKGQWYALLNSIGRGLMEDRSVEAMKKILLLSYYDLPSYLKPCLLYLSIFPEDHMIMRDKLIWRWISEGFVHSESNETNLYELGDSYFNELVNRSLIQPICIDDEEKVEACRIHDMVLGLICSLSSEENFVTILDGTERKMPNSQSKVRRLSIRNSKVDADTISMAHVRTVCFTNNIVGQVLNISSCQVLRVLDLEGCRISDIGYVGNLLHLRYLGLKDTDVEVLPIEIGKVKFLETLDLRRTRIKELPSSVVMLRRLMCLYVSYDMKLPSGIGNMISLEVLEKLYVGKLSSHGVDFHVFRELGHLTKLRVLGLTCEDLDESLCKALVESLGNMHKLEILCIFADSGRVDLMHKGWVPSVQLRRLIIQGWTCPFQTLPTWINPSSLPLLSHLFIGVAEVGSEDIKILGMLPALRHLHLTGGASISEEHAVEILIATSDAFPCATWCYFENITMAPSTFPRGAAPRLKYLRFDFPAMWITRGDCDFCMRHLPSLGKVTVNLIRGKATDSEVNEAEAALRAAAEDHPNRPVLEVEMR